MRRPGAFLIVLLAGCATTAMESAPDSRIASRDVAALAMGALEERHMPGLALVVLREVELVLATGTGTASASLRPRAEPWRTEMHPDIVKYNANQEPVYKEICDFLAKEIHQNLARAESKVWHAHPVWFLDGNPIVGYSRQKPGIRLMFWSGADFEEPGLNVVGKKFKDASVFFNGIAEINKSDLRRWLKKAKKIQWDYRNLVKRKGRLERI